MTTTEKQMSNSTSTSLGSPLGVCIFRKPLPNRAQPVNYPDYLLEVLDHAGVAYASIDQDSIAGQLDHLKLLVTIGDLEFDDAAKQKLTAWVKSGGAWLSIGGACGMSEVLGVENAPPIYANWGVGAVLHGEGYLKPVEASHPAVAHLERPLHFFGGLALRKTTAKVIAGSLDAHQQGDGLDVLFENVCGAGRTMTCSIDLTGTIVRIQQGLAITRDGVPAPDGTGPVADGVLKSGDGAVLDWIFDRQPVEGAPGLNIYLEPIADLWRDVILRSIFHLALSQKIALPVLWMYPRGLSAIAHMSHDSDGNVPDRAEALLALLKQADIHSTWCIIKPGYEPSLISRIRAEGHELAMHYDSMTQTEGLNWGENDFDQQHKFLCNQFGEKPVTNKNHYLRWEGDVDLFDWCERRAIKLDQSKGPSKTGEAGFNFGSCHPYFPVAFDNRYIDVIELPTHTQDLVIFAPPAIAKGLLKGVKRVHGVLHLLFHPAHIGKPGVNEALLDAVRMAKAEGLEWWTAAQINTWERSRRKVKWSNYSIDNGRASVTLRAERELKDATVLWLSSGAASVKRMKAWGFDFAMEQQTLNAGMESKFNV